MKKKYFSPVTEVLEYAAEELLAISSNNGVGYGGVDVNGEKDPASRFFDDDDFEFE